MRKTVEKIIKSANKHNYSNDIIDILKREDLSIDIIKNIDNYYYINREYYASEEICNEINRVLSFPFAGSQKEYKKKLSYCLPKYYKDCILGSINKRRIFFLNDYEGFNETYAILLQRNISYCIIKKIYNFIKKYHIHESDILKFTFYIKQLTNIDNIEFLFTVWSECYMFGEKNNVADYDLYFQEFGALIISTSLTILDQDFAIEEYIKKNELPVGYSCLYDAKFKFYTDYICKPSELISMITKNFDLDAKYVNSDMAIQYNSTQQENEKISKCISLANEIDTCLKLYSKTGLLYMCIRENNIYIKLTKYPMINILRSSGEKKYEEYCAGDPTTMQFYISPSGDIYQKAKYKKGYYPLSVKQLIELMEYKYNDDFVRFIKLYIDYLISKNVFFKDVLTDCKENCLMPLTVNECMNYHNRAELIKGKYKKAEGINIQWNKRNLNLNYIIIKSMPYVDSKGKEILKQIKTFDLSKININKWGGYKYKVKDFLYEIIRKNIEDNFKKEYEKKKKLMYEKTQDELSELQDILPDEQDSLIRYDYNFNNDFNNELERIIYDYIRMCFNNRNSKVKLNIKSVSEIRNRHDDINRNTNTDKNTGNVKVPKNSIFNELRNILPEEFEWVKTRKRLILETKVQHHCVWSYYSLINSDECAIYSYVDKDGSKSSDDVSRRYTIEFRYDHKTKKYYVNQTQGRFDRVNSSKMTEYINGLLDKYYYCQKSVAV